MSRSRAALLILDMINPFDFPDAAYLRAAALRIAPRIASLKRRIKSEGGHCIYVNDNFGLWQSDFRDLIARVGETPGAALAERLVPDEDDRFVLKPKHSAFFHTPLRLLLDKFGSDKLVITGIAAEACVLTTALDAHMHDIPCRVPSDCIAGNSAARKRAALTVLRAAEVDTTSFKGDRAHSSG